MSHVVPVRIDFDAAPEAIHWQSADGAPFVEPFFDDTLRRLRRDLGRESIVSPLDAWNEAPPTIAPDAVIFHVSRCGSTLLSRLLASLPSTVVMSEAPIFDDILRRDPVRETFIRERWLRHATAAFVSSQAAPPSRIVIKLDCWHLFEIETVRHAFPGARLLFVYRDPLEVLVSLMERPSLTLVRDTVTPDEMGLTRAERDALSPPEHAAAILGTFFRTARHHREHLVPLPYTSLPASVWSSFPWFNLNAAEVAVLQREAGTDAKQPRQTFVPDAARKRAAASDVLIDACLRFAQPAYDEWLSIV